MQTFDFRLRFHLLDGDRIHESAEEIDVSVELNGTVLSLKSGAPGVPINALSRAALKGGPYMSEEEASAAAVRARNALLIWAIQQRIGIDIGDGKRRGGLTEFGREQLEVATGSPMRDDVHGIDVFPHREGQKFALFDAALSVGKSSPAFRACIAKYFEAPIALSDKQVIAAELYCSSFFDISGRSRFITLVSAVEALLETSPRSTIAVQVVDFLEDIVERSGIDQSTRNSMKGSLGWLRYESIGQAGRKLATSVLADRQYAGKSPERFFEFCYGLRSQLLHNGRAGDATVDINFIANTLNGFVADLLLASAGVPNPLF